ncbi:phosphoribosyl transferase [Trinickia symbiotica]|uniref:Phosphoribosyl transferase n=1 Tax=Trinickia symbiotica TaxID=863227 RepID=A0A2T3XJU7_9BURK|nr:phosphoribosyltransferase [Trinickia symbiotica]PTB16798.1 phosphoribosyl transferase [Trinickia symbiotica]
MHSLFNDRAEAGRMLAERLKEYAGPGTVVLALPRGGVPVGFELAMALGAELDVMPVRKLGVPSQPELAMGAIAPGGALFVDTQTMRAAHVGQAQFDAVLAQEQSELARRESSYRGGRAPSAVEGRTAILVDDGIATGATMQAAVKALRERRPARIVVAVPVAPTGAETDFSSIVDEFVCVAQPALFFSVGQHYDNFGQTTDEEVRALLERARPGGK